MSDETRPSPSSRRPIGVRHAACSGSGMDRDAARFKIGATLGVAFFSLATLGLWIPGWARRERNANERSMEAAVKSLAAAEAAFRALDADANGIQDFWTGDVAGLFRFGLIDRGMAMADLRPIVPLCTRPVPRDGYYYLALDVDASVDPPDPYRQVTDAASGAVHHRDRFGFIAIPARYGVTGFPTVIINEGNSMRAWRSEWTGPPRYPSDAERRQWSTFG